MKVCLVVEGCYPYVVGGVSSWVHNLIRQFPHTDFLVQTIVSDRKLRGRFAYELPKNVVEVREIYLQDEDWAGKTKRRGRRRLTAEQYAALNSLVLGDDVDWRTVFTIFEKSFSVNDLLMGPEFLKIVEECYRRRYSNLNFTDFLWTIRSMYLPLFYTLRNRPPEADLYHCVCTGYAGVWGAMAKERYQKPLLISEHGIYTREREEEIIKARWVSGSYKNLWIDQFQKMSGCAYRYADRVTSLFQEARGLQIELGCPREKTVVTPNGIRVEDFADIPRKAPGEESFHIGAVLRVAPIKDVKTMLHAFHYAKQRNPRLRLSILGPWDEEPDYAQECFDLVERLQLKDVEFTGRVNVRDYIGTLDTLILTSISEGQPLTILEGFAAHKPCIATNVGNCRGLLYGEQDELGRAGIITPVMGVEKIGDAMLWMADHPDEVRQMGEIGYRRVTQSYTVEQMRAAYRELYRNVAEPYGAHLED